MASSTSTTRVPEVSQISPPPGSVPDTSVALTPFDIPWNKPPPVDYLFFYASSDPAGPFIESLKSSLSLTLQHFFTLAGTVRSSPESPEKLEIHFSDGNAVPFTVVQSDEDFTQLSSAVGRQYATRFSALVAEPSGLLALKVTVFPDHGICLGVAIHHVAADGASTFNFLKSWASVCKSGQLAVIPMYDRPEIKEISPKNMALYNQWIQRKPVETKPSPPPSPLPSNREILATFTLPQDQIENLKERVRASGKSIYCSTFVVSCAYAWVCYVRARGYNNACIAYFMLTANLRKRLDSPIPEAYFGNCLYSCIVEESAGVLVGGDGVVAAAIAIGKAVEGLKDGLVICSERGVRKLIDIGNAEKLAVVGSTKFGVYEVDFGWGKPTRFEVPSIQKLTAISLAEARGGDGGVEIGVALDRIEMDEFEARFYGGFA